MTGVTISLVSHQQRADLERLLPSLLSAAERVSGEILLVDNRSADGVASFIRDRYPSVRLTINPKKAGYGENHNINLHMSRGQYFVIMNTDMVVAPEAFVCLSRYLDQHTDIGIVSPKILNEDGTVQGLNKRYPTLLDLFLRRFVPHPVQRLFRRRLDYYEMRDVGYEHSYEVPFLSGAFLFCRTELLRSLGGFDPGYFLYFEDVDLCRRVQRTHRTVYVPDVSVTHYWQRAAHKSWVFTYYFIRSAIRYFNRWGYQLF